MGIARPRSSSAKIRVSGRPIRLVLSETTRLRPYAFRISHTRMDGIFSKARSVTSLRSSCSSPKVSSGRKTACSMHLASSSLYVEIRCICCARVLTEPRPFLPPVTCAWGRRLSQRRLLTRSRVPMRCAPRSCRSVPCGPRPQAPSCRLVARERECQGHRMRGCSRSWDACRIACQRIDPATKAALPSSVRL